MNENNSQPQAGMDFATFMRREAWLVAEGKLGLHDDPHLLATEQELLREVPPDVVERVRDMLDNSLALPVWRVAGQARFHALNCIEFAGFADQMTDRGIPLEVQQVVAEQWYSLFMSLIQDVDYDLAEAAREAGKPLTPLQRALVRVVHEFVVCNHMAGWKEAVLENTKETWEAEDARGLLDRLKDEAARRVRPATRGALDSVGEQVVAEMVGQAWKPPRKWYQNRGIKAFLEPNDAAWTSVERDLIWKGEFDFALCDKGGQIQAVIEYDGAGHYGNTPAERAAVQRRDRTKDRICRKARIPLLRFTDHYLYTDDEKELACQMLRLLARSVTIAPTAAEALRQELRSIRAGLAELEHRLDIYEKQGASSAVVGVIWELPSKLQRLRVLRSLFRKLG